MKNIKQNNIELITMHKTDSGEKAKTLKAEAEKLAKQKARAMKAAALAIKI